MRLADHAAGLAGGSPSSIGGSLAVRSASASMRDLDAGADHPAQILTGLRDDVEGDRGAEVATAQGPPKRSYAATALTSRSAPSSCGLSSWIGMPVFTPGPDDQAARPAGSARTSPRTPAVSCGTTDGRRSAVDRRRARARGARAGSTMRDRELVGGRSGPVAKRQCCDQLVAVERPRGGSACFRCRSRAASPGIIQAR